MKEKGIPFDINMVNEYDPSKLKETFSEKGLGVFLMQQFVDEVSFLNLGKEGKETHLFKYLNNQPIDERMSNEEMKEAKEAIHEEPLPKDSVNFIIREIQEKEVIEISKCAYSSYGYTYINEDIYFPERIWEQNKSGDLISLVPVTEDGMIMGHVALEIEEQNPMFPQLGMAFVMPRFRGLGCMNRAVPELIKVGREKRFAGIYARGITTHVYSQKSLLKFNFKDTAILLSSGPGREYKGITAGETQRESVMLLSLFLQEISEVRLFSPVKHQEMIEKIYNNLDIQVQFDEVVPNEDYMSEHPVITIQTEKVNQVAHIYIEKYGAYIEKEVEHNLRSLCIDRFETIYLHLRMDDPLIVEYVSEFEELGFFFAGIMPISNGSCKLILQYLNNYRINYDNIQVSSWMAQKIKNYVASHDPNMRI